MSEQLPLPVIGYFAEPARTGFVYLLWNERDGYTALRWDGTRWETLDVDSDNAVRIRT